MSIGSRQISPKGWVVHTQRKVLLGFLEKIPTIDGWKSRTKIWNSSDKSWENCLENSVNRARIGPEMDSEWGMNCYRATRGSCWTQWFVVAAGVSYSRPRQLEKRLNQTQYVKVMVQNKSDTLTSLFVSVPATVARGFTVVGQRHYRLWIHYVVSGSGLLCGSTT